MKTLRTIILIMAFAVLILPSFAQAELENEYDWPNGIRVSYPDSWSLVEEENGVHLRSEDTDILFLFEEYQNAEDVEAALESLFEITRNDGSIDFERDDIFFGGLANFSDTTSYFYDDSFEGDSFQRALFAIPVAETIIVQASAVPLEAREIDELSIVLDILSSLDYSSSRADAGTGESGNILYEWSSGVSIEYPETWEIVEEGEITHIVNEAIDIAIYLYPVRDERDTNRAAAIRETFSTISTKDFDEEAFYYLRLANDEEALGYRYEESLDGSDFEQLLIAVQPNDIFVAVAVALPRSEANFEAVGGLEQIYDILATMRFD